MMTSPADVAVLALDQADWRTSLLAYLLEEVLPPERTKARQIARRAKTFVAINDELYKPSPSGVLMKFIPTNQGKQLLLEVHAGIYGHHAALRSLVGKAFRQGFYWPTALRDVEEVVRRCEGCQFYTRQTHLPTQELQIIPIACHLWSRASTWSDPSKRARVASLTYS